MIYWYNWEIKVIEVIEEVEYAILESSGTLSIFPYENGKSPLPLPIILDGNIQEDTIKHLKKDKKWVYNFLDKKKYKYWRCILCLL